MEGPVFRTLDLHECLEVVPRLQDLAWSSPEGKRILVEALHSLGEIIVVTGDGTNDGPTNTGFSMESPVLRSPRKFLASFSWTTTSFPRKGHHMGSFCQ